MAAAWGQMFIVGLPGPELDATARYLIADLQVGGIILFKRNIIDLEQVAALIRQAQEVARQTSGAPLWVAIDQEGGPVQRLRQPFPETPAARTLGDTVGPEMVMEQARLVGAELRRLGINFNFAPVLDVARKPDCPLWERSYASDPEKVATYGVAAIQGYLQGRVVPVAKHFPGLGATTLDSHLDLPVREPEADLTPDLYPFRRAIDAGVPGIMAAHVKVSAWDELPASLSPVALTQVLRRQLGFQGLIFSDDLTMGAISRHWPLAEAAKLGVRAGLDLLLLCDRVAELETIIAALEKEPDLQPYLQAASARLSRMKQHWTAL